MQKKIFFFTVNESKNFIQSGVHKYFVHFTKWTVGLSISHLGHNICTDFHHQGKDVFPKHAVT